MAPRPTPLHDWHVAHQGRMVDFAGWDMPVQYTGIVEEHHAVRKNCGLFDISHMGRLRFTGPDACRFLDTLQTNDASKLKLGQIRYALVCNTAGGIQDDVLVYRQPDAYWLVVNASNREKIVSQIESLLKSASPPFDVHFEDRTFTDGMIAIQGPKSLAILQPLCSMNLSAMKYYHGVTTSLLGETALVSRTGYTGEEGFEVIISEATLAALWTKLIAAGAIACGLGCRDTLRLEAAMPLYGHELSESIDPFSTGLGFAVKLEKSADFLGKSALQAKARQPVAQVRVGLELQGRRIAREHTPVMSGDQQIGEVTSGTFSPTLEKSIAMAYLPVDSSSLGTRVEVDLRGKREAATVVALPFYCRNCPSPSETKPVGDTKTVE